jgi:putative flippase GtrA
MNVKHVYILTGYLSVLIGIAATLCIYRISWMKYGIALAIAGLITAGINIFLNSKYYYEQEKYPKGYLGMFMSSLPVIFMMLVIFKFRK